MEDAVVQVRGHLAQEVKIEVMRGSQIPGESGGLEPHEFKGQKLDVRKRISDDNPKVFMWV